MMRFPFARASLAALVTVLATSPVVGETNDAWAQRVLSRDYDVCSSFDYLDPAQALTYDLTARQHQNGDLQLFAPRTIQGKYEQYSKWAATYRRGGTAESFWVHYFDRSELREDLGIDGTASPVLQLVSTATEATDLRRQGVLRGTSALIFAQGVLYPGFGSSWETTDWCILKGLLAWNSVPDRPAGSFKLRSEPAYIQLVGNTGTLVNGGAISHVSMTSVTTMRKNIALAYVSGVRHLEIVTHSNGGLTAQAAVRAFTKDLLIPTRAAAWTALRAASTNAPTGVAPERMEIAIHSLQAANSWSSNAAYYDSDERRDESGWAHFPADPLDLRAATYVYPPISNSAAGTLVRIRTAWYQNDGDPSTFMSMSSVGRSSIERYLNANHSWFIQDLSGNPIVRGENELYTLGRSTSLTHNFGPFHSAKKALMEFIKSSVPAFGGGTWQYNWQRYAPR